MVHAIVRGRVQGVGYRAWIERQALRLGLEGWARNLADGSVEAVFAGPADRVAEALEGCRRGPAAARVDDLQWREAGPEILAPRRRGERFSRLPDA
jgi:acylphosphatase